MATALALPPYPWRPRRTPAAVPGGPTIRLGRGFALWLLLAAAALNGAVYGLGLVAAATVHSAPDLTLADWAVNQSPGFELEQIRGASMARGIRWNSPVECETGELGYGMIDTCS